MTLDDFPAHGSPSYLLWAAQVMMTLSGIAYVDDTDQSPGAHRQHRFEIRAIAVLGEGSWDWRWPASAVLNCF